LTHRGVRNADFSGAELSCVDFEYADLRGADLHGLDLATDTLRGTDLRGAAGDVN
jgi:uncharacterized protein YjbI with pentapeptide repeats